MIYCTVGVPSRFSEWCEALLRALVAAAGQPAEQIAADSLDQIGQELLARNRAATIIVIRQPKAALARALIAAGCPLIVTLDAPEHLLASLMADYGMPVGEAVRTAANSLCAITPLLKAEHALVLRESDGLSDRAVASAIAAHLGLASDVAAIEQVVAQCQCRPAALLEAGIGAEPAPDLLPPSEWTRSIGTQTVQQSALFPLWAQMTGKPLDTIVWKPSLFFLGDHPGKPATQAIDVTGAGRCLIYGPYIRLPEGPWSCSVVFAGSERAVGLKLVADAFAGALLNQVSFAITEPGLFEIEFSFVNANPDIPVEIRLFSAAASFEGEIALGQVQMTPLKVRRLKVA